MTRSVAESSSPVVAHPDTTTNRTLGVPGQVAVVGLLVAGVMAGTRSEGGLFWFIPYAGIGALLVVRRPRTSIGWILMGLGWFYVIVTATLPGGPQQYADKTVGFPALVFAVVAFPSVPLAVGIAVLRYRLYEIDRIISRTVGWGLVSGLLGTVFLGLVVGLQALSANITGGSTLAVAASTLVAAALFQPLRRRIQVAVDRRFNRARYDAERTAAAFAAVLRDQVDLEGLEADIARTIGSALRPSSTGTWIRPPERTASR